MIYPYSVCLLLYSESLSDNCICPRLYSAALFRFFRLSFCEIQVRHLLIFNFSRLRKTCQPSTCLSDGKALSLQSELELRLSGGYTVVMGAAVGINPSELSVRSLSSGTCLFHTKAPILNLSIRPGVLDFQIVLVSL